jgi:hypothetical protein
MGGSGGGALAWVSTLRRNRRANAGFALVAVALLLLGGAAALYLHAVDIASSDSRGANAAERAALVAQAGRERLFVGSLAQGALFDALDGRVVPGPGELGALGAAVEANLSRRLADTYPRVAVGAFAVDARLVFARARASEAYADLASPFGGRYDVRVPAFLAVEGALNITVAGVRSSYSTTTSFSARHPLPTLLPVSIASRLSLETNAGGRVERLVGQFAQRAMAENASAPQGASWARDLVRLALGVDLALQFGSSGDSGLDTRLAGLLAPQGEFAAATLAGALATDTETLAGPVSRAFHVDGATDPVYLDLRAVDASNLTVSLSWSYFDGQEAALGTWAALRIGASGSMSVTVGVSSAAGAVDVGPIEVPVAFSARAFQATVPDAAVVPGGDLADAIADTSAKGIAGTYGNRLYDAGFRTNRTFAFNITAPLVSALLGFLADDQRVRLPPLEDYTAFADAHRPEIASYSNGTVALEFLEPKTANRADLQVDGADLGAFPLVGTAIDVPRLPLGVHSLRVDIEAEGSRLQGGASFTVNGSGWRAEVPIAPVLAMDFLRAALARGQAAPARAGLVVLTEAGDLVGLPPALNLTTLDQAAAYAGTALLRLEAMGIGGWADAASEESASEATAFMKILLGLLKDADTAYESLTERNLPIGGLAKSLATVFVRGDATEFAHASIDSLTIAKGVTRGDTIVLTLRPEGRAPTVLTFPIDRTLLVLSAVANGISLMADFVKIRDAYANNTTADDGDRQIAVAGLGVDLARITVQTAQAVFRCVLGSTAFEGLKPLFLKLGTAVAAVAVILDVVALYHESEGNFSKMWQTLAAPTTVAGLTRLPAIVAGATTVVLNVLYLANVIGFKAGPIGAIVALFLLAALLVANKEMVASAIFGTLPYSALSDVRAQVGGAVAVAFTAAAAANAMDGPKILQARRASSAQAAAWWLRAATASGPAMASAWAERALGLQQRARAFGSLADASGRLRFAARALVEQADDFASPPYDVDPGRNTEGYRAFHTPAGWFNFSGEVVVNLTAPGQPNATLGRPDWRALFAAITPDTLPSYNCTYTLTDTNGIKEGEFSRWAGKLGAAGSLFALEASQFQVASAAFQRR